jgi:hypothetical protein
MAKLTAEKERKTATLTFKSASLDQLWSCLQRCLLFEEPSSRWSKLVSQVSRLATSKNRDISELSLGEQQRCFQSVFGTPPDLLDDTARAFNLILALQDLRLFDAADFNLWLFSQSNDDLPVKSDPLFKEIASEILQEEASDTQSLSLQHAWDIVPYWRVLESSGPWADDPLAEFACSFMNKLDNKRFSLNLQTVLAADEDFRKTIKDSRSSLPSSFQPAALILVEGNTETILLPRFLKLCGSKLAERQSLFISCGGANQLLRKYLHLRDVSRLPILCVVDHDAEEQISTIKDVLRDEDRLHVWSVGEIEDTFPEQTLLTQLNDYLQALGSSDIIRNEDLADGQRRTEMLDRLWRNRGLGDFDKVGFAEFQITRLKHVQDVPEEGRRLMDTIKEMNSGKQST